MILVDYQPTDLQCIDVTMRNAIVKWSPDINAGVCCSRYHVLTSNGTNVTTPATNITLYNVTQQERKNGSISVGCVDQIGTMGPKVDYKLDNIIGMLNQHQCINERTDVYSV